MTAVDAYTRVADGMHELEMAKACRVCRRNIRAVRLLWEELAGLQVMYDDMADHPRRREWPIRFTEVADRLNVLGVLAHIYGLLRRLSDRVRHTEPVDVMM